jgi:8-oxo-dGTP diphosphatase
MKPAQDSPDFPNAFYRVTAKGLCVHDGKVLLIHDFTGRSATDPSPEWELPGGGLDFGENFTEALKREVREEMGLEVAWIEDKPTFVWTTKHDVGRGMEWYWICSVFFRFDLVSLDFTPTEECREIRFFSKEDLKANFDDLGSQVKPLAEAFDTKDF